MKHFYVKIYISNYSMILSINDKAFPRLLSLIIVTYICKMVLLAPCNRLRFTSFQTSNFRLSLTLFH
jgi:hypothetical protein